MTSPLLLKGFEVELFTGLPSGQNVGVASDVAAALDDFVTEPDCRNVEYITAPIAEYRQLSEALLQPRRRLRTWLASRHAPPHQGRRMRSERRRMSGAARWRRSGRRMTG